MLKIKLSAIYSEEKKIRENITKYSIKEGILFYNTKRICKINCKSVISCNRLFVYRTNKIEEYEIKKRKNYLRQECKFEKIFHTENIQRCKVIKSTDSTIHDTNNEDIELFSNCENFYNFSDYFFLLKINNLTLYNSSTNNKSHFFYLNGKIHFIYKSYLVTYPCNDVIYKYKIKKNINFIDIYYESINNKPKSIYKMFLIINLFENLEINILNKETINFIHEICLYKPELFNFINFDLFNISDIVDLYRKLDKKELKNFINFDKLSFKDMKKIVLFDEKYTISYIEKCIEENKEWEIVKIIKIFKDTKEMKSIINLLMRKRCFYLLSKIFKLEKHPIMKIEECVMKSYKLKCQIKFLDNLLKNK
ncbi:uncharacterized protein VNE69_01084 [Vairimorpha necatrix]|uniref:Uncharacterized protein n=1 Tax=Vairimorpha necatrix TaxID=6039 RepID=A0AAX4J828_9MICR